MQGGKIDIPSPEEGRYGTNSREDIVILYPDIQYQLNVSIVIQ